MDVGAARGAVVDVGAARGMVIFFEVPATEEGLIGAMAWIVGLDEKRELKSSGGGPKEAKGKDDLSKMTCREINRQFVVRSRHRYPLWSNEYPRKTLTGMGG
jgi:hypothetical protein